MAITKIQSESMNLADTYAFTGTVTGAGESNSPLFVARKNGDQTGITNNTYTKITGWTEITDPDSTFDTSNGRFTPGVIGKYFISLTQFIGAEANSLQRLAIYLNGSRIDESKVSTGGDVTIPFNTQAVANVTATTDYIEAYVLMNGTHTRSVYSSGVSNQFSGFLIST